MADITINGPSNSPGSDPDPAPSSSSSYGKGTTINFKAGSTGYPTTIYFKSSSIFGTKSVSVPSTHTIKSNANSGNYKFYNEAQTSEDDDTSNGAQVGTIKVT